MNTQRIKAVFVKDIQEFSKSRYLVSFTVLMPLFLCVIMPLSFTAPVFNNNSTKLSEAPYIPKGLDLNNKPLLLNAMLTPVFSIYLLIPIMISSVLGAYSFVGEKTKRTIEPILASPVSDSELLFGKILGVMIPAMIAAYFALIVSFIIIFLMAYSAFSIIYIPPLTWILALAVAMPLLAFIGVNVNVIVSFRVNDIRAAQQLSAIVVLPIIAVMISTIGGILVLNFASLAGITAALFIACLALFKVSLGMFNKEKIVTSW